MILFCFANIYAINFINNNKLLINCKEKDMTVQYLDHSKNTNIYIL